MNMTLESLGFTKEDLQDRVVERCAEQLLRGVEYDENGASFSSDSQFKQKLEKRIQATIDECINKLAEQHILPNVSSYIENLTLTQTNAWGEKAGAPTTFIEYLTKRAEAYMQEKVDNNGKGKTEGDSYGWSGKQTRITYLVNSHLQYSIETAMKDALKIATSAIAVGLHETVRLKLNEIAAGMKVAVSTK